MFGMPTPDFSVCGLLSGENNLTSGCHRVSKAASFSSHGLLSNGRGSKNAEKGFMLWSPVGPYRKQWVAKKRGFFSKIITFNGTINIFLNMVAVHIEGPRNPSIYVFNTFFRVNVPLGETALNGIQIRDASS
jgi:hypothetical protein